MLASSFETPLMRLLRMRGQNNPVYLMTAGP